ncbi:ribonuclease HII [Babesia ovata]|uniref:Ribonuclease n=1 Tax=Babesia ovata TaxID=189622 RepID=A0A2H6KI15_9APIC|nr:ribonuclease HII [Babesia ovata]GBE62634.1 ribonuclease HII [Babesia ovata]
MVYGGFVCPIGDACNNMLKDEIGVNDSKKLTADARVNKFRQLNTASKPFAICAEVLTPKFISYKMLQRYLFSIPQHIPRRDSYNLNKISHDSAISLIRHFLSQGFNLKEVYVDAVGSTGVYEAKLRELFPGIRCVVATKADSKFPVVSAASIVAKVIRDNMVESWLYDKSEHVEVGSGYPSDPTTVRFLSRSVDKVFGFSTFVRTSWATAKNILADSNVAAPFEWYEINTKDNEQEAERMKVIRETEWPPFRTLQTITEL